MRLPQTARGGKPGAPDGCPPGRADRNGRIVARRNPSRRSFFGPAPAMTQASPPDLSKLKIDRSLAPVRRRRTRRWVILGVLPWPRSPGRLVRAAAAGARSRRRRGHDVSRRSSSSCSTPPAMSWRSARPRSRPRLPAGSSGSAWPKVRGSRPAKSLRASTTATSWRRRRRRVERERRPRRARAGSGGGAERGRTEAQPGPGRQRFHLAVGARHREGACGIRPRGRGQRPRRARGRRTPRRATPTSASTTR